MSQLNKRIYHHGKRIKSPKEFRRMPGSYDPEKDNMQAYQNLVGCATDTELFNDEDFNVLNRGKDNGKASRNR